MDFDKIKFTAYEAAFRICTDFYDGYQFIELFFKLFNNVFVTVGNDSYS